MLWDSLLQRRRLSSNLLWRCALNTCSLLSWYCECWHPLDKCAIIWYQQRISCLKSRLSLVDHPVSSKVSTLPFLAMCNNLSSFPVKDKQGWSHHTITFREAGGKIKIAELVGCADRHITILSILAASREMIQLLEDSVSQPNPTQANGENSKNECFFLTVCWMCALSDFYFIFFLCLCRTRLEIMIAAV